MKTVIRAVQLKKRFGRTLALGASGDGKIGGVDLAVGAGEILGIVGPNGAGKSTLLDVFSGMCTVDAGRVFLDGKDITYASPRTITGLGLSRTFQFPRSADAFRRYPALTFHQRRNRQEAPWSYPSVLNPSEASGVVAERLYNLMLAIALRPRVLLLDEPLIALNATQVAAVSQLLIQAKARGCAVILVEHHLELVRQWADTVCFLDMGRVEICQPPSIVWANPCFRDRMLTETGMRSHEIRGERAQNGERQHADKSNLRIAGLQWNSADGFQLRADQMNLGPGIHRLGGPTGSGKSALMGCIMGSLPATWKVMTLPAIGSIDRAPDLHELAAHGIRWAPENAPHTASLTVQEVFRLVRPNIPLDRVLLCEGVLLGGLFPALLLQKHRMPHALSGGQRQMLNLARAFLQPAHIILLDRPFQNLDEKVARGVEEFIVCVARFIPVLVAGAERSGRLLSAAKSFWIMDDGLLQPEVPGADRRVQAP